ncbi:LysR substrate-binding domain-containing protein, partial [Acinetobacter oleivorans]|uniref:LysR substrate-binding domain-containing protein n=1 Tax=Acinetobacter oleivorans TaxID=1148157 RepID=UPI00224AD401
NSVTAIHQMALSSLGVAICPAWLVDEDIQQNRLIRLFPDFSLCAIFCCSSGGSCLMKFASIPAFFRSA